MINNFSANLKAYAQPPPGTVILSGAKDLPYDRGSHRKNGCVATSECEVPRSEPDWHFARNDTLWVIAKRFGRPYRGEWTQRPRSGGLQTAVYFVGRLEAPAP
jgi:hypothetical protein